MFEMLHGAQWKGIERMDWDEPSWEKPVAKRQELRVIDELMFPIHPEMLRRVKVIDDHNYNGVCWKVNEWFKERHGYLPTSRYIESGVYGLKQYYAVALLDPLNAHAVSAKIDQFWHAHMLYSQEYSDFCNNVIGRYMHHVPLDTSNEEKIKEVERLYDYTLDILQKLFGELNKEDWPRRGEIDYKLICFHGKDYSEVNHYALFPPNERGMLIT